MFAASNHNIPKYLQIDVDRHIKFVVTKFRFGISDLYTHLSRYRNGQTRNVICPLCKHENEVHFVLCCPQLQELRKKLIPHKFYRIPNSFHLSLLVASKNENTVKNFSIFLYKAFQFRKVVCSQMFACMNCFTCMFYH